MVIILRYIALLVVILSTVFSNLVAQSLTQAADGQYRRWLEEEVRYIISDEERAYFLTLTDDSERKDFIRAFWAAHDPTPITIENEYKTEHYRRLEKANRFFTADVSASKKLTRKHIYILLGEPEEITRFDDPKLRNKIEIWKYSAFPVLGIEEPFYLLWMLDDASGLYEIFPSGIENPSDILQERFVRDPESSLKEVFKVDILLGHVSLSHLESDHKPLMINNRVELRRALSHRNHYHNKLVKLLMEGRNFNAQKRFAVILENIDGKRGIIRFKYNRKDISVKHNAFSLINEDGELQLFLAYLLEGKELALNDYYGRCYGVLSFEIVVRNQSGNIVTTLNDYISISFESSDVGEGHNGRVVHLAAMNVPNGKYSVTTVIRNPLNRTLTQVRSSVEVKGRQAESLYVGSPVFLLKGVKKGEDDTDETGLAYYPSPDMILERGENAELLYQVSGNPDVLASNLVVRYRAIHNKRLIWQHQERLKVILSKGNTTFTHKIPFPTRRFAAGNYILEISLLSGSGNTAVTTQEFVVDQRMHQDAVTVLAHKSN